MRSVAVVSVGRSDYGIYLPILRQIQTESDLKLLLFVSGMHLSPRHGSTIHMIEADGFPVTEKVEMLSNSDSPVDIASAIGRGVIGFAQVYERVPLDILVTLGDRFEMYSAVLAALPFNIPVAHIHGGEITKGAIDDALRHSMTKLSHLHFVSTQTYAKRVIQLGEEPWRVTVSGAPSLDNLETIKYLDRSTLQKQLGIDLGKQVLLVTFHPVTLEPENTEIQIAELLSAIEQSNCPALFTIPNADSGGGLIAEKITAFVATHANAKLVKNLGTQAYFSLMKYAAAMVGNSSSGIIEAPSFSLPFVNIGLRQEGRLRGKNVIDVPYNTNAILKGIRQALNFEFKAGLKGMLNPYHQGNASEIIVNRLKNVTIDKKLLMKSFHDLPTVE